MALDKNKFDTVLKDKSYYDLGLRIVIWLSLSLATTYLAFKNGTLPDESVERFVNSSMPLINAVLPIAFGFSVLALMLKDLEDLNAEKYGFETGFSKWGGFVRRIAGDLMLWVLGGFVGLLSILSIAVISSFQSINELKSIAVLLICIFLAAAVLFLITYVVRRDGGTTLIKHLRLNTPRRILCFYVVILFIIMGYWMDKVVWR